ncbi:MAG TPA: HAMP domain-containing sensor histidine kinase [Anaerolineales bacterium]|nr:HAMP domain-containing sensor histidine kinase [Anaerolineales bacterium]
MNRLLRYLLNIFLILTFTLGLIYLVMHPPMGDLVSLAGLLAVTGLISGGVGFLSHRMGWWRHVPNLAQALALSYLLAAGLTLVNVWVTARLMFINEHDLVLATMLLLFASGVSVAFGYFISTSVTQALRDLMKGAEKLSEGDFSVRVPVEGGDEVAHLARSFNEMAVRLEQARQAELALDDARRNLVAWASHDLRTPLASLQAMIDALAEGVVDDPETITRYLNQSQQEIDRMSALIEDLFELAQIDAGGLELQREAASLSDLVSDTLGAFAARAVERNLSLTGEVSPGVDPIWMAPEKISRVFRNLIENAIRHTPAGGEIHVRAGVENGSVVIAVSDSGTGIPPEHLPHVFDRFYRGEKSRSREGYSSGGAGLGLAIAKGIVEAHGGRIWVESQLGQGTVMQFSLPKGVANS